ncbi:unnamed protein product [Cylicocyclus nassatus]|uniref:Uncharacterized protein n=1 Tax=Cylicocyclus nassatus TaxID=53992 RepID=A0AA36M2Y5_CYLNA|nr:unnamed protein product [Cylicocyclus nassatus]
MYNIGFMLLSQQMSQERVKIPFQACAVGSNVVVLRDDLSRVQITTVYGIIIRIFEPKAVTSIETEHVDAEIDLVMGDKLLFCQQRCLSRMSGLDTNPSASHTAQNERAQRDHSWNVVWSAQVPHAPKYTRHSRWCFLAVAGEYDHTVKIFCEEIGNSRTLMSPDRMADKSFYFFCA